MFCSCNHCESEGRAPIGLDCLYADPFDYAVSMGGNEDVAESFVYYMREEVGPVVARMDGYSDPTIGQTAREWPRFLRDDYWTEGLALPDATAPAYT